MSKVVTEIAVGLALVATAIFVPYLTPVVAGSLLSMGLAAAASIGVGLVLGGIAQALQHQPGNQVAVRQAAMPWIMVYGRARVGGCIVYMSLTSDRKYLHMVVVHAGHFCHKINGYYLDGKQVYFSDGGTTSDHASRFSDSNTHYDPAGNSYNFKGDVYIETRLGNETGQAFPALNGWDTNWPTTATLQGHCVSFFRLRYDANLWTNGYPSIKVDIVGKADIYDPRTGTNGYTENPALCINDVLQNQYWGLGCPVAEIDTTQLIAAANLCDESVPISGYSVGGTQSEPRYTVNGSATTEMSPGQILQSMATAAGARIVFIGGVWKIFPAAWIGPSLSFGDDDFIGPIKWSSVRKYRDLANGAKGVFVCPTFPYNIYGPGYANNQKISGVFDGQWQQCDIPPYAQDPLHGYASDANLTADGNVRLWTDVQLPWTISVSTAQRLLKIYLLRNRQQGSGTISLSLRALQASALDVIQLNHSRFGWVNKQVEISNYRLQIQDGKDGQGPLVYVEADVQESDPSVYEFNTTEELTIEDNPSPALPGTGIISQATLYPVSNGNRNSSIVGGTSPLTATDAGSSATVAIAAFQLQFGFGQVDYNAGTVAGQPYSTVLYVYAYDPGLKGGSVSYFCASGFQTVVSDQAYVYIGPILTPASGAPPTGGTGNGGGCPCPTMVTQDGTKVGELAAGDALLIRTGDDKWIEGEVHEINGWAFVPCVALECENGAAVEVSWDTPVHPRIGAATAAAYCDGAELPTLIDGAFQWSRVKVQELGPKDCVKVYCGCAEFAAGRESSKLVFTHNIITYGK